MSASRKRRHQRRAGPRIPRPASPPMLVNRGIQNSVLEMRERMFVQAFSGGWATTEHYDNLADMRDCLLLAAAAKKDASTIGMCRAVGVVMMNIRDRYTETKHMGVSGDELTILREFATTYRDFWLHQTVASYEAACAALSKARACQS